MKQRRVVITGFMGAGKTTVARTLARLLAASFVDLDDSITQAEGRSPRELIDEEGEQHFREAETRALRRELEGGAARVIATGGGAWTLERNRALAAAHGCLSVWLDAPFDLCLRRIEQSGDREDRPFARDATRARRLYEERLDAYSLADLRVRVTTPKGADELAAEIAAALGVET
ncbi:MAG: shikimate kinase [Acidobacteriota bacterium]|jgi:shikimate kinase|nr:shikimate kinase [Acidobacteriota bacterium]